MTAMAQPFHRIVAWFGAEERHGKFGHRRATQHLAADALQAAWNVDRYDGQTFDVEPVDQLAGDTFDRRAETGAEQRVDHERARLQQIWRQRLDRPRPQARSPSRVALQRAGGAQEAQPNRP